mmetsp:Transcript_31586/g.63790  ORF Transcript_31586/g.63790 Transcript_31586/m.63790 type:complete len:935 (+) Transcript_31586:119-2923(+)
MQYSAYHQSPPSVSSGGASVEHHYSSPTTLQSRANLRSCLRQGNFSSNRSTTRSTTSVTSHPHQQQQSRGDDDDRTARSAPITTTGSLMSNNNDNDERQFMKLSNMLATQHKSGNYSSSIQGTRQLLHYYIPSARQRQLFYQSLCRNRAVLPMFPEPNENPGYALTRYVDRVFGPLLERECSADIIGGAAVTSGVMGPPSPTRTMQSTRSNYNGQIQQPSPIQHFSSPINYVPPSPPPEFTSLESRNHRPMLFPSPNNLNQSIQHLSSPINNIPPPMEYATNTVGNVLFPPPNAARDEVTSSIIDRVPPPIQPSSPMAGHIPPQQQQHLKHHVSFPMYSPPDDSNTRDTSRHPPPLPRPYTTTTAQQPSLFASPSKSLAFTIGEELNKTSHIQQHPSMNVKSLLNITSTDTSLEGSSLEHHHEPSRIQEALSKSASMGATAAAATTSTNPIINKDETRSSKVTPMGYQKFSNSNMLPPITPRENILYHLPSRQQQVEPSCCNPSEPPRAKRKRPTYLQLYVKCERSEPYLQPSESMDIVTHYRNGNNQVTADRSLVVRGTTSLLDLIGGIIEAFGLYSDHSDACMKANASSPLLMAYNDICFMSDVKSTTKDDDGDESTTATKITNLTPLPIPGFYYKYVDREVHGRPEMEKESLLSTDPVVLTRTLVAQVLDKPLYPQSQQYKKKKQGDDGIGFRSRLALVYCAPKRQAYLSPRTQKGVLPETIYHFQLLLDGIVPEEDLPSSFTSQTAIRCVGSTGGVAGGSMIDSKQEIQDLNRTLWGVNDVVGLVHPTPDPQRNLEQIIDVLDVPLFDNVGNQTLKELPLDRCLYHIYSGNLSLSMAKKTQRTVEKMQGTSEWLAKGVEAFTKGITSCVEDNDILFGGDDLDGSMSRLSVSSSKSRQKHHHGRGAHYPSGLLAAASSPRTRRRNSKRYNI